ncbi:hypothetical protein NPIL_198991 [Nephila pilipes]|uniref:Uncharacterized protein n=1 Tax=Nephila pilipes TaxID=299642 RepID=A0A8X6NR33_NEPPI|nr:hypothetical protein NPIL_198991 [Nephila pilipes]
MKTSPTAGGRLLFLERGGRWKNNGSPRWGVQHPVRQFYRQPYLNFLREKSLPIAKEKLGGAVDDNGGGTVELPLTFEMERDVLSGNEIRKHR